jgi:pyruvate dehydrogenase E1 component beta subunit
MELCEQVHVLGQLVDYQAGIFGTTTGLVDRFGSRRVLDFPVSESVMTAAALGSALAGNRPVVVHQRLDFMIYSLDAIANWLALWRFKSNGESSLPVVIRAVVGRGWGQGPQHSKSLHAWFAHLPGLHVAIPATAYDAKGLLLEAILGENPVMMIEHRSLFSMTDVVPEQPYRVRFGRAAIRRAGNDVTLAAIGMMVPLALQVAERLHAEGIDVEVIDLRTISPLDRETLCTSAARTGRLVVADPTWQSFGAAAEVVTTVCEEVGSKLHAQPVRICLPDSHTPMSSVLEEAYYPGEETLANALRTVCGVAAGVSGQAA